METTTTTTANTMLFGSTALARRIESVQAQNQLDYAEAHRHLQIASLCAAMQIEQGAAALFAGAESPLTQSFGLGFPNTANEHLANTQNKKTSHYTEALDRAEEFFFSHGVGVTIELANLADMEFTALLGARNYAVCEYSHVLGLDIRGFEATSVLSTSAPSSASQFQVQQFDANTLPRAANAISAGFLEHNIGEREIPDDFREMFMIAMQTRGTVGFAAETEGEIAGAGGITLSDGIALLSGASTQPKFRNRGIQKALIDARLQYARAQGCDVAVVTTAPGTVSQENMQKLGFRILYARTKFFRPLP